MPSNGFYRELELAGLVGANGSIDRPLRPGWWPIFRNVDLIDKEIRWVATEVIEDQVDTDTILDDFIKLPEKMPAAYLGFVRKYGPLRLHDCLLRWNDKRGFGRMDRPADHVIEHGFLRDSTAPMGVTVPIEASPLDLANHIFGDRFPDGLGSSPFSSPLTFQESDAEYRLEWTEPISVYRSVAITFRGMLLCVKHINTGEVAEYDAILDSRIRELKGRIESDTNDEDCAELERLESHKGVSAARSELQTFFARMVEIADIQPRLNWTCREWKIDLCFPTTLGALVSKLMMVAVRADCLYTCSGCGMMYVRSASRGKRRRAPKAGLRNYCPNCGIRAARLDAKRDYRHRQAEKNRIRPSTNALA